ncbi:CHAT domain-containing tetratricopeptide repeat protein [Gloeobacter morelensis]|uniref:CHAT domain-containing protein n=1 Tax=Gloeobacter morelensis MG652769 TaxID=2781736 RepID=A0ABY3PST0_9CYAN|nr:CHAT domain-containing tetratricopeptide repeat protein [Gloeobacter morelensis]UFP96547.1 CHAT domain-containing protein [Gloeobacter morelensis MG652769]
MPLFTPASAAAPIAGNLAEAELLHERSLQLWRQGDYAQALEPAEQAMAVRERLLGPEHPDVAASLNHLGNLLADRGDYGRSELLYERALAIRHKVFGSKHPSVAASLNNLAILQTKQGRYREAEPLYERALAIREQIFGPEHPEVAKTLINLAAFFRKQGRYREAEPLYERALAIHQKVLGPDHPEVATNLNNLALLYVDQGRYREAEPLYERALAIHQKVLGPDHPQVAKTLNNLAILQTKQGRYREAEPLYERALAIHQKVLGPDHPEVATNLNNLALLYVDQGKYLEAEPLLKHALVTHHKTLGLEHPDEAQVLHSLAVLYTSLGRYREAEPLLEQALAIHQKAVRLQHPIIVSILQTFASLRLRQARLPEALGLLQEHLDVQERLLGLNLAVGDEARKRDYLDNLAEGVNLSVSTHLHHAPADSAAARLALNAVLQIKGRLLDELAVTLARLRARLAPGEQGLLDRLTQTRSALAALVFQGLKQDTPQRYREQLEALEQKTRQLEADLTARGAVLGAPSRPVSVEAVQQQLPADSALVELVRYRPYNPAATFNTNRSAPERYAAYLLPADGPVWAVDLVEAATIDRMVLDWRVLLAKAETPTAAVRALARQLDSLLMQPLRARLGDARALYIAPDAQLNLLPFGALVDERGRYLLEDFELVYLTSGRDLLRLAEPPVRPRSGPLLVAAPDFESARPSAGAAAQRSAHSVRSADLAELRVQGLPGAADEAAAILALLPGARSLIGAAATENALKASQGPLLLHMATHGFFLPPTARRGENPLLRSGLALAGFNKRSSGSEDGVLTALEAIGLDLEGTELVVLSACDTGLGEVAGGEGVYGLRRALSLAGARSQVFSLWKVGDAATAELMVGYYRQLLAGRGRGEALRRVQLELLRGGRFSHPYWWAAFVATGDPRALALGGSAPVASSLR